MGNFDERMEHVAHLPRTGFDMSQSFAYTTSVGMILPVYQDILNPGEKVYLNGELFARTQPLVNSAMADVDVYLDWFWIPTSMLYLLFPSIRWETNDLISSVFQAEVDNYGATLPLTDMNALLDEIQNLTNRYAEDTDVVYTNGSFGSQFDCVGKSVFRLLNHIGMNPYGIFHGDSAYTEMNDSNPSIFPLFLMAYQAIFQDYFRIDDFEKRNISCFNADNQFDQQSQPTHQFNLASGLTQLNYRPRHKDYFTSVSPSPLSSSVNLISMDNSGILLRKVDSFLSGADIYPSDYVHNIAGNQYSQTGTRVDNYPAYTTSDLRSMFAVEKLLRIVGRSKKDYDSQVLAHLGFKVPHDVKHQLTHLFEQHAMLHIGEVTATADTFDAVNNEGSALGAVGGKGYINVPRRKQAYEFVAPCDGVIMCVQSLVPRFRYYNTFDKQNAITSRLDFYTEEFDKLGKQPLYRFETDFDKIGSADRVGWQYRYKQHKQKYDRCTEAFLISQNGQNYYSSWILAHKPFFSYSAGTGSFTPTSIDSLYVAPTDLNSIMQMQYTQYWSPDYMAAPYLLFDTDPFICDFRASVKKVSYMSQYGEPSLNGI